MRIYVAEGFSPHMLKKPGDVNKLVWQELSRVEAIEFVANAGELIDTIHQNWPFEAVRKFPTDVITDTRHVLSKPDAVLVCCTLSNNYFTVKIGD